MKTRAPSADGANLGHHAEPTLEEDLCAEMVEVGGAISARCGGEFAAVCGCHWRFGNGRRKWGD